MIPVQMNDPEIANTECLLLFFSLPSLHVPPPLCRQLQPRTWCYITQLNRALWPAVALLGAASPITAFG